MRKSCHRGKDTLRSNEEVFLGLRKPGWPVRNSEVQGCRGGIVDSTGRENSPGPRQSNRVFRIESVKERAGYYTLCSEQSIDHGAGQMKGFWVLNRKNGVP